MSSPAQPDLAAIAAKYGGAPEDSDFFRYPPGVQILARQLVDYKMPVPQGMSLARPNSLWNSALQAAAQLDPTFDATQYGARFGVRKDFTSGPTSKNLTALNTVINHLGEFKKVANQLDNSWFTPWNTVANKAQTIAGKQAVPNFETVRNAVASELTRVFRGTSGAEADVQAWQKAINSSESPEQLQGALDQAMGLIAGRVSALEDQWNRGIGKPRDFHFLSDKSRQLIQQLGYDPDALERGTTGTAEPRISAGSSQSGYSHTATGPNGQKIGFKNGKWYDVTTGEEVK